MTWVKPRMYVWQERSPSFQALARAVLALQLVHTSLFLYQIIIPEQYEYLEEHLHRKARDDKHMNIEVLPEYNCFSRRALDE